MLGSDTKICNRCKKPKPKAEFSKGGKSNHFKCPYCKACRKDVQAPYHKQYKESKVKEKIAAIKQTGQLFLIN